MLVAALLTILALLLFAGGLILGGAVLWNRPSFREWVFHQSLAGPLPDPPDPRESALTTYPGPDPSATDVTSPADLYQPSKIWSAHLHLTADQWKALGPRRVPGLHGWLRPGDHAPILRNPAASRAGVAGVFGFDFPWSSAEFDLGGQAFTNVGLRFKGDGTFLDSRRTYRRPYKVDLDRRVHGRDFVGLTTLNLHNLVADRSFLADTLGYEFYREAGLPAPRTTFARLFLTIDGRWERRLLGLYLLVENPDADWIRNTFPATNTVLFKPTTLELFEDLGDDWEDYEAVYEPKTKVPEQPRQRLRELARLVSHASDTEFSDRVGDYLDLDRTARYFACETLLSNYDGIYSNGQNYLLWWDPRHGRFGFSPWDLDHSWGEFGWIGTARDREQASLFHPWVGKNRFLERLFAVDAFQDYYRGHLTEFLDALFVPERLHHRLDELASAIRPAIEEFSADRLQGFESAIEDPPTEPAEGAKPGRQGHVHNLKRFITARASSARDQLEGRSEGIPPRRNGAF